jgi:hypothetical protein
MQKRSVDSVLSFNISIGSCRLLTDVMTHVGSGNFQQFRWVCQGADRSEFWIEEMGSRFRQRAGGLNGIFGRVASTCDVSDGMLEDHCVLYCYELYDRFRAKKYRIRKTGIDHTYIHLCPSPKTLSLFHTFNPSYSVSATFYKWSVLAVTAETHIIHTPPVSSLRFLGRVQRTILSCVHPGAPTTAGQEMRSIAFLPSRRSRRINGRTIVLHRFSTSH